MTFRTPRHNTTNDHPVFPPQKEKYNNGVWKNRAAIGSLVVALLSGIGYLNTKKNPETDKFMQSIGIIPGIEHINISK